MQDFWVMWTYLGNYSDEPYKLKAESAQKAADVFLNGFSEDFRKKGSVFVFDKPPVLTVRKGIPSKD